MFFFAKKSKSKNKERDSKETWSPYAKVYDPLKAGSIDGTDTEPHDKAVTRAINSHYEPPHGLKSKPEKTLFVSRFGPSVDKHDLKDVSVFNHFIVNLALLLLIVAMYFSFFQNLERWSLQKLLMT